MTNAKIICPIIILIGLTLITSIGCEQTWKNNRVVIGVLAQFPFNSKNQYIAASYVKYLESAGARVAPVFIGHPKDYYENLLKKLNGILLPGGGSPLEEGPYAESMDTILDIALNLNKNGTYFPVWCTCLSFEKLIGYFVQNYTSWKSQCRIMNISLNLTIVPEFINSSKLFQHRDTFYPNILNILTEKNVTAHYHRICIEKKDFEIQTNLTDNFNIIGINEFNNWTFVSLIEHKNYPIFGSMFHPEKPQFEFIVNKHVGNINHDQWAIIVSQYFANFFVSETRNNCLSFENKLEESEHLIYSYNKYLVYTGNEEHSNYEETYRFPESVNSAISAADQLILFQDGIYHDNQSEHLSYQYHHHHHHYHHH